MKVNSDKINLADDALNKTNIVVNGQYDKVFKGYISSFGASIAQAGLLPTIIFFEGESEQAQSRKKVIEALIEMLNDDLPGYDKKQQLAQYILKNGKSKDRDFQSQVTEAMVAMKLALRMYKEKNEK